MITPRGNLVDDGMLEAMTRRAIRDALRERQLRDTDVSGIEQELDLYMRVRDRTAELLDGLYDEMVSYARQNAKGRDERPPSGAGSA